MANQKEVGTPQVVKTKQQVVDMYLNASDIERMEMLRFRGELKAIDTKVFIPITFDYSQNVKPSEYLDTLQKNYLYYNCKILKEIMEIHKMNKKKIFKYITTEQMADIYIGGKMKLDDLQVKLKLTNRGCCDSLQMYAYTDKFKEMRDAVIQGLKEKGLN